VDPRHVDAHARKSVAEGATPTPPRPPHHERAGVRTYFGPVSPPLSQRLSHLSVSPAFVVALDSTRSGSM
jgi:hypothetical protein